ncbi:hypothetical protein EJB05_26098, partial [Eragrostis curvula]
SIIKIDRFTWNTHQGVVVDSVSETPGKSSLLSYLKPPVTPAIHIGTLEDPGVVATLIHFGCKVSARLGPAITYCF